MPPKDKKSKKEKLEDYLSLIVDAKTRSDIWEALYATAYECESQELNEAMAAMTDEEVFEWFPKVMANFIAEEFKIS